MRLQAERELHLIYRNPFRVYQGASEQLQKVVAKGSEPISLLQHSAVEDVLCNHIGIVFGSASDGLMSFKRSSALRSNM